VGDSVQPIARTDVMKAFTELQELIKTRDYDKAWQRFTSEYQMVEFSGLDWFKGGVERGRFNWAREELLELEPKSVGKVGEILRLQATRGDQTWTIDFVQTDGHWKVDWIRGYVPGLVRLANWKSTLLPNLQKRRTEHFDIHTFKGSTAERDIEKIAKTREEGHRAICDFIGSRSEARICLVFFEDKQTKHQRTGHQGAGWATGDTIVEVYNDKVQLDPYHETTHVLMRGRGNPPALFNEGFAVYMSERLGASSLKNLGGGQSTLHERVRALRSAGDWIPLAELLTYTEIGSTKSRPPVSYAEAGAFVKFLIERRGVEHFLKAYRTLRNSPSEDVQRRNADRLAGIYGQSIESLEKRWIASLSK